MNSDLLVAFLEFPRARLLGTLETIEKSGQDVGRVLAWRPGPGRAHIAWQAMHCAATHDRYLNVRIFGGNPRDEVLVNNFAGGSTPSDQNVPSLEQIRRKLAETFEPLKAYLRSLAPEDLQRMVGPAGQQRTVIEVCQIMAWHESHHQGQMHLTWNLYRAAHGG